MSIFSKNLRWLRKGKNLSQTQLANKTGLNRGNIAAYEKEISQPNAEKLTRISSFLGVSIDTLMKKDLTRGDYTGLSKPGVVHSPNLENLQSQNSRFAKMLQGIKQYHIFKQEESKPQPKESRDYLIDIERLVNISKALLQQNNFLIQRLEEQNSEMESS